MKRLFTLFAVVLAVLVSLRAYGNTALIVGLNDHSGEQGVTLVEPSADDDSNATEASNSPVEGVVAVDLGLSVKWASCNIGATKPEEFGDYFAWGEVSPKKEYSVENSLTYAKDLEDISGDPQYDAATANWGGDWRMPTYAEVAELVEKCSWKWTKLNGVKGVCVKGPNGNTIFLPATGVRGKLPVIKRNRSWICYWTSTPFESIPNVINVLDFDRWSSLFNTYTVSSRFYGRPIRPVSK